MLFFNFITQVLVDQIMYCNSCWTKQIDFKTHVTCLPYIIQCIWECYISNTYPVLPCIVAWCRGVLPDLSVLSNLAPFSSRNSHVANDPYNKWDGNYKLADSVAFTVSRKVRPVNMLFLGISCYIHGNT